MDNPPDDGPCEVTITAPDYRWLQVFARQLVEDRLAASAHIDRMTTTYRWAGVVHEADEARVVLHTSWSAVSKVRKRVSAQHPFEVPCMVVRSIESGIEDYLSWIEESTEHSGSRLRGE